MYTTEFYTAVSRFCTGEALSKDAHFQVTE